jgi:predicted Zn-dependent protease
MAVAHSHTVVPDRAIRVFVDPFATKEQGDAIAEGFGWWSQATDHDIEFEHVSSHREADVQIWLVPHLHHQGQPAGGVVRWTRAAKMDRWGRSSGLVSATMSIRALTPSGKTMNAKQLRHIAAHEMGHVLGLGDSAKQGDVMGPLLLSRPALAPSADEIDALLNIRREARDIQRLATSEALRFAFRSGR